MKKLVRIILGLILVLVTVVVIVLAGAGYLIKTTGAQIASDALGVPVSIAEVHVDYKNQSIHFGGLKIGSPEGYKAPHMLNFSSIDIDAENIFAKPMIIDSIKVGQYEAYFEIAGGKNNFSALNKKSKQETASESEGEEFPVVINLLDIAEGDLHSSMALLGEESSTATLPIPGLVLKNLGSKTNPTTAEVVITKLVSRLSATVMEMNPQRVLDMGQKQVDGVVGGVKNTVGKTLDSLGGIFGKE